VGFFDYVWRVFIQKHDVMNVGVFGSRHQEGKSELIRRVFEKLRSHEAGIYIDSRFYTYLTGKLCYDPPVAGLLTEGNPPDLDIALSLGGDGTFLRTVARVHAHSIPILGINTGHLGFLADIGPEEVEDTLDEVFEGCYRMEDRTLLQLGESPAGPNYALNEVAILKRDTSSMITIHTRLDGEYLTSYRADGLVVATPTGSTAYSMSVNGPIIVPRSNSIVLSPVAPHSLNVRPLVVPDTTVVTLHVESRSATFLIAMDGRSEVFRTGTDLRIAKATRTARIIKRYNHTFYKTLRGKLMWGTDVRESSV
jgi:NAD+ kinase